MNDNLVGEDPVERRVRTRGSEALHVGEYTVRPFGDDDFWIENSSGEGMQVFRLNFERLIDAYFQSEF